MLFTDIMFHNIENRPDDDESCRLYIVLQAVLSHSIPQLFYRFTLSTLFYVLIITSLFVFNCFIWRYKHGDLCCLDVGGRGVGFPWVTCLHTGRVSSTRKGHFVPGGTHRYPQAGQLVPYCIPQHCVSKRHRLCEYNVHVNHTYLATIQDRKVL